MTAEDRYARPLELAPGRLQHAVAEPISVGSMLWVFTDPHRGHEFAYNRWYERDHYYAGCMIGASTVAGSRWVATRRHKDARFPAAPDMPFARDAGSYACLYYILEGRHDAWVDWATPQATWLYEVDRGFEARTHYNTGTYRHRWRTHRDPDPVPLELALDHRYPGLVAQFVEPTGGDVAELDDWFDRRLPSWLPESPVATVSTWSFAPLLDTKPDFVPDDPKGPSRLLQLFFVERDPLDCWQHQLDLATDLEADGVGTVAFAAPFVATEVGTDRYVGDLW